MMYLISHMLLCLIIAFLLGLFIGYLLCKIFCGKKNNETTSSYINDHQNTDDEDDLDVEMFNDPSLSIAPATSHIVDTDSNDAADITDLDTNVDLDSTEYGIQTLEGIGPRTGDLFRGIGIATVGDYLRKLYTPQARIDTAQTLDIKVEPLHDWAGMSDLLRIQGMDHQFAELAYASGIKTVGDIANASADTLRVAMEDINNAGPQLISPVVPTEEELASFISQAKKMKSVVRV